MTVAVSTINKGRRSLAAPGEAENGRINFEKGHTIAMQTFQEALASGNVELILLAEYLFVSQELAESDNDEPEGKASAEAALQSFDDDAGRISAHLIHSYRQTERSDVCLFIP
jgi:hypothetical protein